MNVKLLRVVTSSKGTYGVLAIEDSPICVTLELPWKENKTDISCIPKGKYTVTKYSSPKYTNVWKVLDVPNREDILMHCGNYMEDTHGCILVGTSFGDNMIVSSKEAMNKLNTLMGMNKTFQLEIL